MSLSSVPETPEGSRRVFQKEVGSEKGGLRQVDAVQRAYLIRALTWGGLPGFIIGGIAGAYVTRGMGLPALLIGVGLGGLLAGAVVVGTGLAFSEGGRRGPGSPGHDGPCPRSPKGILLCRIPGCPRTLRQGDRGV